LARFGLGMLRQTRGKRYRLKTRSTDIVKNRVAQRLADLSPGGTLAQLSFGHRHADAHNARLLLSNGTGIEAARSDGAAGLRCLLNSFRRKLNDRPFRRNLMPRGRFARRLRRRRIHGSDRCDSKHCCGQLVLQLIKCRHDYLPERDIGEVHAISVRIAAPSVASAHRSLPEKAGTAREKWHRPKNGRFRRRIAAIHPDTPDVTGLLLAWRTGDEAALERLVPIVHGELRRIARRCMAGERAGHSLQATALVNEAYLRLVDVQHVNWQNRAHFLAMSARLMRRILVDYARSKGYQKRGGGAIKVTFDEGLPVVGGRDQGLVAVDDALEALAKVDERKSRVVELRFFGGLSVEETASVLKVSPDTVMRDWKLAKAWLLRELRGGRLNEP
jgi:RNA polymerase sigma-70 factor (ECF subfamily)